MATSTVTQNALLPEQESTLSAMHDVVEKVLTEVLESNDGWFFDTLLD